MTIEKNNWNRWKKTAGSFDMEEIQMALRNYNTREENEMQDLTQKQIDLAGFSEELRRSLPDQGNAGTVYPER